MRSLLGDVLDHPVQKYVEALPCCGVGLTDHRAGMACEAAGHVRLTCSGQCLKARDQDERERSIVVRRRWGREVCSHAMPRCCFASGVIMSGVQGGS